MKLRHRDGRSLHAILLGHLGRWLAPTSNDDASTGADEISRLTRAPFRYWVRQDTYLRSEEHTVAVANPASDHFPS
jgi:hypothetical protein